VDTSGFFPGKDREWRGMIRHGAQLVGAYARATVPRVCVVLRKAYGGAFIVMDSKTMGNDLCLAWPSAEMAVMGARQAAGILYRREAPDGPPMRPSTSPPCSTPGPPPSGATSMRSSIPPTPAGPSSPPSKSYVPNASASRSGDTTRSRIRLDSLLTIAIEQLEMVRQRLDAIFADHPDRRVSTGW
jgi:hypothetical protein